MLRNAVLVELAGARGRPHGRKIGRIGRKKAVQGSTLYTVGVS
jgi:hypothetical protein